jgi:predicted TIM-barrel fold metal-dependent hydrolase
MKAATDLASAIGEILLVDSHEHLSGFGDVGRDPTPAEREWVEGDWDILRDLFGNYITADLVVAGASQAAVERLIDPSAGDVESRFMEIRDAWERSQHTGYGEAVRLVAHEVYGLDEITLEGLETAQARLEELRRPGEMLRLLRETARLDHVQIDDLSWACQHDPTEREFFLYDLSWFHFSSGLVPTEAIHKQTEIDVRGLQDLQAAMAVLFQRFAPWAVAVKSQHAYSRTLEWTERSDSDASTALSVVLANGEVDEQTRLILGDWCLARGVELAVEHNLPVKLHTGYLAGHSFMEIDDVRVGNLCGLLARYPGARFVLMHTGYPYNDEIIAIAKHYPNVWIDMCWAWTIDPSSSLEFVRRFLHSVPTNKLFAFGGDTTSPTNTVGYAIQARRWLTRALEAEIAAQDLTERQAIKIAQRIMRDNQYACFDIDGTRHAVRAESETARRAETVLERASTRGH